MLLTILTNRWVLMVVCTLLTFGEMFVAKNWFVKRTSKITNAKVKRGVNIVLGTLTCFVLAAAQMYALCDVLGADFAWKYVLASTVLATWIYYMLEKVFGESEVNALGKAFSEFISHSDMFDGNLTTDGVTAVAEKLLGITNKIDNEVASKQAKAVDAVVERLSGFLNDGVITDAERAEADKIIAESGVNLNGNSTYEKYRALLNK